MECQLDYTLSNLTILTQKRSDGTMTKSVLLTRSNLENAKLKEALKGYDYEILECSLINQELQEFDYSELRNFTDIIVTSFFVANAMPKASSISTSLNAWVVGEKSANTLAEKGYNVMLCVESARHLKNNIPSHIYKTAIYLSGNHITVDMPKQCLRKILYRVTYRKSLSMQQVIRYKTGIDYILLYSENCAKTLVSLIRTNNLVNYLANTTCIVISSKVEKVVKSYFRHIVLCHNTDTMLKYLQK